MISGWHKRAFGVAAGRVAARRPDRDFLEKDSEPKTEISGYTVFFNTETIVS
jgi:hypothetical protein